MKHRIIYIIVSLVFWVLSLQTALAQGIQRFPKPEFENGYVQPAPTTPEPTGAAMAWLDLAILAAVLSLTTYMLFKKRSRNAILAISLFSMIWFGFVRHGCVCSVGSVQNVALAFASPDYVMSWVTLGFFLLPLLFALFFGRTFCAGACPLGVIQDVLILKPIEIPLWAKKSFGLFPYLYLGLAILFAATGSDFIICRFDPFIAVYRLDGPFAIVMLGICLLLIGMFVARPYCRFICPYGVLLKHISRFSWKHMSISPANCISCKLCESSCPFDAISKPTAKEKEKAANRRKFITYTLLLPLYIVAGAALGYLVHPALAKAHPDVYMANLIAENPEILKTSTNLDIRTFAATGGSTENLIKKATAVMPAFKTGSMLLGAFMGLVIGTTFAGLFKRRETDEYTPDKGDCYSCGRCMKYCPVKPADKK
jgi:NosR/NirI family transcriptional regulator, nitrous oxide reductase regulator